MRGAVSATTDARRVAFDPPRVIARFEEGFDELIRDYLHMVMHCIFRHPFDKDHRNRQAWNLTCDIIAESVALEYVRRGDFPPRRTLSGLKRSAG